MFRERGLFLHKTLSGLHSHPSQGGILGSQTCEYVGIFMRGRIIIQPLLKISNPGRKFLVYMIFGTGKDPGELICANYEALDTKNQPFALSPMADPYHGIV